jgi:hypothetical protein
VKRIAALRLVHFPYVEKNPDGMFVKLLLFNKQICLLFSKDYKIQLSILKKNNEKIVLDNFQDFISPLHALRLFNAIPDDDAFLLGCGNFLLCKYIKKCVSTIL